VHLRRSDESPYVLGHSDGELARLEEQAELFREQTEYILLKGGLAPGMRVLDVGCGVGDVALAAARIVGPDGSVTGLDNARSALHLARSRAAAARLNVEFVEADAFTYETPHQFDALVGRFILMHLPRPELALTRLVNAVRPGGVITFIEMDIAQAGAEPPLPLLDRCLDWIIRTYEYVGVEPNMGSRLYRTFREAGLEAQLTGSCRIEGGTQSVTYHFVAESLKSLLPAMENFKIATAEEVGVDIIADRLRQQAVRGNHCIFFPRVVGAWAEKPE